MKTTHVLVLVALLMIGGAILVYSQSASLQESCSVCAPGDVVTFSGSGFHKSKGNDAPTLILWGSAERNLLQGQFRVYGHAEQRPRRI